MQRLRSFLSLFPLCPLRPPPRWNFSVGNFELKFIPEVQSNLNFLEGEMASGDSWREERQDSQRVITDDPQQGASDGQNPRHLDLDLVIKVSVPDWKVMAFSTKPSGQLVWEHQVGWFLWFSIFGSDTQMPHVGSMLSKLSASTNKPTHRSKIS